MGALTERKEPSKTCGGGVGGVKTKKRQTERRRGEETHFVRQRKSKKQSKMRTDGKKQSAS